jgi:hypothetical protein
VLEWLLHQTEPAMIPLIGPRTFAQYEAAMAALDIPWTSRRCVASTMRAPEASSGLKDGVEMPLQKVSMGAVASSRRQRNLLTLADVELLTISEVVA